MLIDIIELMKNYDVDTTYWGMNTREAIFLGFYTSANVRAAANWDIYTSHHLMVGSHYTQSDGSPLDPLLKHYGLMIRQIVETKDYIKMVIILVKIKKRLEQLENLRQKIVEYAVSNDLSGLTIIVHLKSDTEFVYRILSALHKYPIKQDNDSYVHQYLQNINIVNANANTYDGLVLDFLSEDIDDLHKSYKEIQHEYMC